MVTDGIVQTANLVIQGHWLPLPMEGFDGSAEYTYTLAGREEYGNVCVVAKGGTAIHRVNAY